MYLKSFIIKLMCYKKKQEKENACLKTDVLLKDERLSFNNDNYQHLQKVIENLKK